MTTIQKFQKFSEVKTVFHRPVEGKIKTVTSPQS